MLPSGALPVPPGGSPASAGEPHFCQPHDPERWHKQSHFCRAHDPTCSGGDPIWGQDLQPAWGKAPARQLSWNCVSTLALPVWTRLLGTKFADAKFRLIRFQSGLT